MLTSTLAPNPLAVDVTNIETLWNWGRRIIQRSYIHHEVSAALEEVHSLQATLFRDNRMMTQEDPQAPVDFRQAAEVKSSTF